VWQAAVVAALVLTGGAAVAQTVPAGPIVLRNESGAAITITNVKYTDEFGAIQKVVGQYSVPANFKGYLLNGKNKIRASKFEYDLITDDGKTVAWSCQAKKLDTDGNFVSTFTAANLADHRKLLGVTVPAVEKANGPTDEQVASGVLKALLAMSLHKEATKEPADFAEAFSVGFAKGARDELIRSAIDDLFPQIGKDASKLSADLTVAALDGRMTSRKLSAAEAHQQTADYIRAKCPKFEHPDDLAAFLVGVEQGARKSK
jgi:hypothetical protein